METKNWAVEVGPNDRRTVIVDGDKFLHITKVAMGDLKNGEEVKDLHVYLKRYDGRKVVLAILSSEGAREATITKAELEPREIIELSHGWQNGRVHFTGHFVNIRDHRSENPYHTDNVFDASSEDLTEEEEEEQQEEGSSSKIKKEAGPESWAVEVGPNERLKVEIEYDRLLRITKVAMGDRKNEEEVQDFHVYFTRINGNGETVELAILSSEHTPEAITNVVLMRHDIVEFSHGWKNGSVHISGHFLIILRKKDDCPYLGPFQGNKQKASLKALTGEEDEQEKGKKKNYTDMTFSRAPTSKECMEIVEGFSGFQEGTKGYTQALLLFYSDESARVHFMIPKTHFAKMDFLKAVLKKQRGDSMNVLYN